MYKQSDATLGENINIKANKNSVYPSLLCRSTNRLKEHLLLTRNNTNGVLRYVPVCTVGCADFFYFRVQILLRLGLPNFEVGLHKKITHKKIKTILKSPG